MAEQIKKTIIVINGSPRKTGTVACILHSVADNIDASHTDIHWYNVNDMHIHPCIGCMKCRSTGRCVLPEDDAHRLVEDIESCSGIILGSPVYWGNISGQMKVVFDRLVAVMMGENKMEIPVPKHKDLSAVIVTACTTPWPFNIICGETTYAVHAMREILCCSGFRIKGTLVATGTKNKNTVPARLIRRGKKIAKKLT